MPTPAKPPKPVYSREEWVLQHVRDKLAEQMGDWITKSQLCRITRTITPEERARALRHMQYFEHSLDVQEHVPSEGVKKQILKSYRLGECSPEAMEIKARDAERNA